MSIQDYDDTNPFITYSGSWTFGKPGALDGDYMKYYQQTWSMTINDGNCAEIRWKGTDITVWGSRRFNHGYYSVSIDSSPKAYFNGYAEPGDWSTPVISTFADNPKSYKPLVGVKDGNHVAELCNEPNYNRVDGRDYFDIDRVQIRGTLSDARAPGAAPPPAQAQTTTTPSAAAPPPSSSSNTPAGPASSAASSPAAANPAPANGNDSSNSGNGNSTGNANSPGAQTSTTTSTLVLTTTPGPAGSGSSSSVSSPASGLSSASSASGGNSTAGNVAGAPYSNIVIATGTSQIPRLANSTPISGSTELTSSAIATTTLHSTSISPLSSLQLVWSGLALMLVMRHWLA